MPVYEYHCANCKSNFPVRKSIAELDSPTTCPECNSSETQRLISVVAVFSTGNSGEKRALAGVSACSGCSIAGSGCATCRPR